MGTVTNITELISQILVVTPKHLVHDDTFNYIKDICTYLTQKKKAITIKINK